MFPCNNNNLVTIRKCLICSIKIREPENSNDFYYCDNEKSKKASNGSNSTEFCERFCKLICRYLNINSEQFRPEKSLNSNNSTNNNNDDEPKKSSEIATNLCDNCLPAIQYFNKVYEDWYAANLKLVWSLKRITGIMKKTVKVPYVGPSREKEVQRFRSEIVHKVQKNCNMFPVLKLHRTRIKKIRPRFENVYKTFHMLSLPETEPLVEPDLMPDEDEDDDFGFEPADDDNDNENDNDEDPLAMDADDLNNEDGNDDDDDLEILSEHDPKENKNDSVAVTETQLNSDSPCRPKHFVCIICGKSFAQPRELTYHKRFEHKDENRFICKFENCGKALKTRKSLLNHRYNVHQKRAFGCQICGQAFSSQNSLIQHQKELHKDSLPYQCDVCEKAFNHEASLRNHKKIHETSKRFKCGFCDQEFRLGHHLRRHVRIHTGDKPMKCGICGQTFNQWSCCKSHQRTVHKTEDGPIINLQQVDRQMKKGKGKDENTKEMLQHPKVTEPVDTPVIVRVNVKTETGQVNDHDSNTLASRLHSISTSVEENCRSDSLANAEDDHDHGDNEEIYFDDEGKVVSSSRGNENEALQKILHKNQDSRKKTKCKACNKEFAWQSNLRRHLRDFHGIGKDNPAISNRYKCDTCNKLFQHQSSLGHHRKIHEGKLEFVCEICGRAFLHKHHLRGHQFRFRHINEKTNQG